MRGKATALRCFYKAAACRWWHLLHELQPPGHPCVCLWDGASPPAALGVPHGWGRRCAVLPGRNPAKNPLLRLGFLPLRSPSLVSVSLGTKRGHICLLAPQTCSISNGTYIFGVCNIRIFGIWPRLFFRASQWELLIKRWLRRGYFFYPSCSA